MYFVNSHRRSLRRKFLPFLHPGCVSPFITVYGGHAGSCSRPFFRIKSIGVSLVDFSSIPGTNAVLIQIPFLRSRNKQLINSHLRHFSHGVSLLIPIIKGTCYRHASGIRGPDCEPDALFPILHGRMSAHFPVNFIVGGLAEQILIQLSESGRNRLLSFSRPLCFRLCHNFFSFINLSLFFRRLPHQHTAAAGGQYQ